MLASGTQEPVTLAFHNLRLKEQFAGFVAKKIEPDSTAIIHLLDSAGFVENMASQPIMFIPFSTQLLPAILEYTPEKFFKRMYANYQKFWTPERKQKAAAINLDPRTGVYPGFNCRC